MNEHEFFDRVLLSAEFSKGFFSIHEHPDTVSLSLDNRNHSPRVIELNKADVIYMAKLHGITAKDLE